MMNRRSFSWILCASAGLSLGATCARNDPSRDGDATVNGTEGEGEGESEGGGEGEGEGEGESEGEGEGEGNSSDVDAGVLPPQIEPGPHFFVHLSDIHIGSGSFAKPSFEFVLGTVLPIFGDVPVLASGDLLEAGDNLDNWAWYEAQTTAANLSAESYIECPGNHDSLLDGDLSNYVAHSVAGRAGRGLQSVYNFTRYGQRIRVITTNTAGAGDPVRDGAGYLDADDVDDLIGRIAEDGEPHATLVMGHHPRDTPDGLQLLGTDDQMDRLLEASNATAYVFGHSHLHGNYWSGRTLMTMAATSGNPGDGFGIQTTAGFSLLAIDDGPTEVAVGIVGVPPEALSVNWPVVLITRPAERGFATLPLTEDANPWATPLPRATAGQVLHAGAFAPGGVDVVTYRVDDGPPLPMEAIDDYYRALFTTPDAGECEITVHAEAGLRVTEQTLSIQLE